MSTANGKVKSGSPAANVDLESILVNDLGQFGRYQWRLLGIGVLISIVTTVSFTEYLFTTSRSNTRCLIPECEKSNASGEFDPSWLQHAIPAVGSGYDNCQRFGSSNLTYSGGGVDLSCPANLFDKNTTKPCDTFVYEESNTIVYDFDMACKEWHRSLIGSARTFGNLVGLPITGFISDRWGRRTALVFNSFNTAWIGITRYFADNYLGFIISEFIEAVLGSGTYSCICILILELVGPKYRVFANASIHSAFSVGQILVAVTASAVPYWRNLTLTLYVPQLLVIIYYWILPESIIWYQSKGRFEEAERTLKNVARFNQKELSDKTLLGLQQMAEHGNEQLGSKEKEPWLIVQVFRNKPVLLCCMVSPIWWITMTFVYYGMSINAVNMVGNRYLNFVAVAAVEIPGFYLPTLLIDRVGRRPIFIACFWICALCQVGYIFVSNDWFGLSLFIFMVGKFCIAAVATTLYVYNAELYPTKYRHSLFAFSAMVGRIGAVVAPLTPAMGALVWEHLPFVLFAVMALVSGLLVLLTPETLGSKLPDTMEEAANLGRKKLDITRL